MKRISPALMAVLTLAGCGPGEPNPPTEPATSFDTGEAAAAPVAPPPGVGSVLPGTGPRSFVGRWAADVAWCPNTTGPQRPIEITTTRFEGYENSCALTSIDQVADGYVVALACTAEGVESAERLKMTVSDQTMRLTWLDRDEVVVSLTKCTTLADTPPA